MSDHSRYESSVAGQAFFTTPLSASETNWPETSLETSNPRRVWLSSEYGTTVPIWNEDGLLDSDNLLSSSLENEIIAWSDQFNDLYDPESGWANTAILRAHYFAGIRLHRSLSAELGSDWDVGFDFWERKVAGVDVPLEQITGPTS